MNNDASFKGELKQECKYGENAPQMPAGLFVDGDNPLGLGKFEVVAGTDPSYNNWAEIDRQLQTITHIAAGFEANGMKVPLIAVGTKHGNVCGAAVGDESTGVLQNMLMGDSRSIFGGLVMLNFPVDKAAAEVLVHYETGGAPRRLLDGVMAPEFSEEALEILARKGGKCRCVANPALADLGVDSLDSAERFRYVRGGFLQQPNYLFVLKLNEAEGAEGLSDQQQADALLAWGVGSTSNSNTISIAFEGQLIGNGVGQQDRVSCCELAIKRATDAGHKAKLSGAAAYSDSFFPFPDGPEYLIKQGIRTIVATSGSVRDEEVRKVCESNDVRLVQVPDSVGRGFFGH